MADDIMIELDPTPADRIAAAADPNNERPLELDLGDIAEASTARRNQRELVEPTARGAADAPVHHEDTHANDEAIEGIKARAAERRERDAEKKRAEEQERIRQRVADEQARLAAAEAARPVLRGNDLVAGAAAEGNGVLVGWRGKGDMTRAAIATVLERAGLPTEWTPEAVSAEAQASRALATLKPDGFTVRTEKKKQRQVVELKECDARWLVDSPNFGAGVGDKSGDVVLVATLTGDKLELEGDEALAERVRAEYKARTDAELCKSADITTWMQNTLVEKMDAVRYGVGWYVPRVHAALAGTLCKAFEDAGWGAEDSWISPSLPIATGDQLRTGILRGLTAEVKDVLDRLSKEREIAKTKENREDIGPKRAVTFLNDLKTVGRRVVGYGTLLGAERVSSLRTAIADAVAVLETSLSEEDRAIVERFANVWDEIERDRAKAGGVL